MLQLPSKLVLKSTDPSMKICWANFKEVLCSLEHDAQRRFLEARLKGNYF